MDINKVHTKKDLDNYIKNKVEESTHLEFKDGRALGSDDTAKIEISKDVSAFANADGGILIYGISEKDHVANGIVTVDGNKFTKEWLEQVINIRVNPTPEYTIDPIRIGKNIKTSAYVIRIPKSSHSPHQAGDKCFYRRRNFKNDKMEEYEIKESYFRPTKTMLQILEPAIDGKVGSASSGKIKEYRVKLSFGVKNIGSAIEDKYKLEIRLPPDQHKPSINSNDIFFKAGNRKEGEYYVYTFPKTSEIFQGEICPMASVTIIINIDNIDRIDNLPLLIRLYYSSGIENMEVPLLPHCKHEDHKLTSKCFREER